MYNVSFPGLGLNFQISSIAFSIGSLQVRWYGLIIAVGLCLAVLYCCKVAKRFDITADKLLNVVIVGTITGIIGARLYYVIFTWDNYKNDLMSIFRINEGGLAIYGGIIGALIGGLIVAKITKMNIPGLLDVAALGFLIGQGLGRWGNFFNQEAFGTTTDLPWRMVSENTGMQGVHPCFLYESLWCLLGFVLLHFFSKSKYRKYYGQIGLLYLVWYGFERTIVEGLRTDSLYTPIFGLRVSQVLSFVLFGAGLIALIIFAYKKKSNLKPVSISQKVKAAAVAAGADINEEYTNTSDNEETSESIENDLTDDETKLSVEKKTKENEIDGKDN